MVPVVSAEASVNLVPILQNFLPVPDTAVNY